MLLLPLQYEPKISTWFYKSEDGLSVYFFNLSIFPMVIPGFKREFKVNTMSATVQLQFEKRQVER